MPDQHKILTRTIHKAQVQHSKVRRHEPPEYSLDGLRDWIYSQPNYMELFNSWVNSGFKKELKPSVDRLDNSKNYSFSNIQLVTWRENDKQAKIDRMNGVLICGPAHKKVVQLDMGGNFLNEFISIRSAARSVGKNCSSGISACCTGRQYYSQGFKWLYKEDYEKAS